MPVKINPLCVHHVLDGCDCGNTALNGVIARKTGTALGDYDPDEGLIIVADEDSRVRGYLTLANIRVVLKPDGQKEDCLFIAQLGVTGGSQGANLALRPYKRAEKIAEHRMSRRKYAAMLATSVHNEDLSGRLLRMGFQQAQESSLLGFKRLDGMPPTS